MLHIVLSNVPALPPRVAHILDHIGVQLAHIAEYYLISQGDVVYVQAVSLLVLQSLHVWDFALVGRVPAGVVVLLRNGFVLHREVVDVDGRVVLEDIVTGVLESDDLLVD